MTVLRSRVVKSKSVSKTPRVSSIEPRTPCSTRETQSGNASAIVMDGSRSGGVRRSLRLASKSRENVREIARESVSSRKRKREIVEDSKEGELGFGVENVVVEVLKEGELGFGVESGVEVSKEGEGDEMIGEVESGMEGDLGINKGNGELGFVIQGVGMGEEGDRGCLRLRSGKKVVARGFVQNVEVLERATRGGGMGNGDEVKEERLGHVDQGQSVEAVAISDEGQGRLSREDKGKGNLIQPHVEVSNSDNDVVNKDGSKNSVTGIDVIADRYRAIMGKRNEGSKGDGVDVWDELISKCVESVKSYLNKAEKVPHKGKERARDDTIGPSHVARRRLSGQEKGKGKLAEIVVDSEAPGVEITASDNVSIPEAPRTQISNTDTANMHYAQDQATRARDRFRAQARKSASRFAFFSTTEEEQNHVVGEAEPEMAPREINSVEDWPGPFSTAMKIIKERGMNVNLQHNNLSSGKEASQGTWIPKHDKNHKRFNLHVPLLQDLCMTTLTKNADALTSLDYVPDVLRHKLSHMLCDMRRMNSHFLQLLVRGSPTEIRVRDCSWLSEEDFTKIFAEADINNLAVLQLDQCGRCMPDYILYSTLGRSPNCLPLLSTLSLKGACRLSDIGLSSLLSSAPALRSINLSQCSLLTSGGINNIADSLGSVLRELYVDDCESIDLILMLPALSKLEYLEVLSLAGLHTVCDDFICQLVSLRGHKLKELVLADCVDLTDISLRVISKSCTGICALDLTNLCKLTDCALGYLANGCELIRSLKLRRNIFSDEAVAAYLETSGGSLEELSLNNISKVGYNTAISLSKCSKNLQNLDLSFCRNMSNEAVGLIVDSCLSLKTLKLFGCTQITDVFLDGHSNEQIQVIGRQMTPILGHIKVPELIGPLRYSSL